MSGIPEIDFEWAWEGPLFCPCCGTKVLPGEGECPNPCEHTLFIATEAGFEHASDAFIAAARLSRERFDDLNGTGGGHTEEIIARCDSLNNAFILTAGPGDWVSIAFDGRCHG